MDTAPLILASRQLSLLKKQDRIADQIANVNTPAFKVENDTFDQNVVKFRHSPDVAYPRTGPTYRDTAQGTMNPTARPLDVAIQGEGYFQVETPLGSRFTRDGSFTINSDGALVTKEGYLVLGPGGQQTEFAEEDSEFTIRENGLVSVGEEDRGQIGVFTFENEALLERVGTGLYKTSEDPQIHEGSQIVQGVLEGSNVVAFEQMSELISLSTGLNNVKKMREQIHKLSIDTIKRLAQAN